MTRSTEIRQLLMRQTEDAAGMPPSRSGGARRLSAVRETTELSTGDVLEGRYALLSPLGEGGMGDVWLAHNAMLDVQVALKVLRVDDNLPDRRAKLTQRLLTEARAAAKIDHPAIVRITDFGETPAGNGFYVMELLEGEDLHALLERHGRLSATKSVRTLLPIAAALVAAHGKNVVHRDLKPENIFLARNQEQGTVQPKLIDFGIAKLKVASERITIAGTVMGSPGYMAPEQARGEDVDERADVWGFSVVLYETVTGRLPFEGKNYNALMRSIIEDQPSPITAFGVGDDILSEIIERGLAKDPDKRWQSMRDLGAALARWLLQRKITEDICGTPLAATWIRHRTTPSFNSGSPPDPFVSGSIAGAAIGEARRARAEMATEPPPALSAPPHRTSVAPPPKASFIRSRPIAIVAVGFGALAGAVLAGWALDRSTAATSVAALPVETASAAAPPEPARSTIASAPPREAPPEQATAIAVTSPRTVAPQRPSKALPIATQAAPAKSAAPPPSAPTPVLKNPF